MDKNNDNDSELVDTKTDCNLENWHDNMNNMFDENFLKETSNQDCICIYFLYIDKDDEIIKITKNEQDIHSFNASNNGFIDKDFLVSIIHRNILQRGNSKFLFDKLLLYHIPLQGDDLKDIQDDDDWKQRFNDNLFEINIYRDFILPKSLILFHDINSLFIFYREKPVLKSSLKQSKHENVNEDSKTEGKSKGKHIGTKRVRFNHHKYTRKSFHS